MWNFFDLARENNIAIQHNPATAPDGPGVYMLFGLMGNFVYIGKASNLSERLAAHFSPDEPNMLIKLIARYFIFRVTSTIEEAESLEAASFDQWYRAMGQFPIANNNRPPNSTVTDVELGSPLLRALRGFLQ